MHDQIRAEFLTENLRSYSVAEAVNALDGVSRVYVWPRQLIYYLDAPAFFASPNLQTLIDVRDGFVQPARFYRDIEKNGFSHLILVGDAGEPADEGTLKHSIQQLHAAGCLSIVEIITVDHYQSRTLKNLRRDEFDFIIWKMTDSCALAEDALTQ